MALGIRQWTINQSFSNYWVMNYRGKVDSGLLITLVFLFVGLKTLWSWVNFDKLSIQTFQPLIVIYRRRNFVYHHWGCKSIFRLFSHPFTSRIYWDTVGVWQNCKINYTRFFAFVYQIHIYIILKYLHYKIEQQIVTRCWFFIMTLKPIYDLSIVNNKKGLFYYFLFWKQ